MTEVPTSILNMVKRKRNRNYICTRAGKNRLFSYRCYGWKVRKKKIHMVI